MEFIAKFKSVLNADDRTLVNAGEVLKEYKKTKGHSGATQVRMLHDLQIQDYVVVRRRGRLAGQMLDVKVDGQAFKYTTMSIFIDITSITVSGDLVERIKVLPDETSIQSRDESLSHAFNPPLLELEDHEKFVDVDGNTVEIEVRGSDSCGIFFKAKDIERYFGIDKMVKRMLRTDRESQYKLGVDYVIVNPRCRSGESAFVEHSSIFLILNGLLKVLFTSKSGNANKNIMHDWIVSLVYKHKFGSKAERAELAKELTRDFSKHMLNKSISGLYYVDIGELNDLYDSMQISRETYPPETYGACHIAKIGLSSNIFERVKNHGSTKNGYARWSKSISHKWSVMVSPSQLNQAEKLLKTMLKANGFAFEYIDPLEKKHLELIIVSPVDEPKIKSIYRDLLNQFPSRENELAEALNAAEDKHKAQYASIKIECERKLRKMELRMKEAEHGAELGMKDAVLRTKDAEHRAEILEYQLQIERMKSASISK